MNILDGNLVAKKIKQDIHTKIEKLNEKIGLAVILVGNNPASQVYVKHKIKDCEEVGFDSEVILMDENTSQQELLDKIAYLNNDENTKGILVQLPLPKHIDEDAVINAISPEKDVDAFTKENVGSMFLGEYKFAPCTPAGIIELLKYYNIDMSGKHCVIIGRSNIVGKPMAMLMLKENATVTICHSKTENMSEITKQADILVAAVGQVNLVTADMVKDGAIVIDVGMNRNEQGKLCGDVDFEGVKDKCSWITPVPGGVGPMTRAILMQNTLKANQK